MTTVLIVLTLVLAFSNGANDVSKGIATLVGSGVTNYKRALVWGTLWTVAGGLAAAFASQGLVAAFSGKDLLAQPLTGHAFLISVAGGAILWLLAACLTGLPVSTTHAITGALGGAGIMAIRLGGIEWIALGKKFAMPLLVSPLLSMALMLLLFPLIRYTVGRFQKYCVCMERGQGVCIRLDPNASAAVAVVEAPIWVQPIVGQSQECESEPAVFLGINALDALHWLTSGLTSFARGLNDTPKILALGVAAASLAGLNQLEMYALVAFAMGLGSFWWGLRVTETLAAKVTPMSAEEGFSANLITSALVGFASYIALPVSTTHVSSGAIMGIGMRKGGKDIRWRTVKDMFWAWIVTLPAAAIFAMGLYALISGGRI